MSDGDARERVQHLAGLELSGAGSGRVRLTERLRGPKQTLEAVYRRLAERSKEEVDSGVGAEWMLDNYYVVERAFRLVLEEFPEGFERRLRRIAGGALAGEPLVYALAREIARAGGDYLDIEEIARLVADFQTRRALSIAEAWALPAALRIAVLEDLAQAAASLTRAGARSGEGRADGAASASGDAASAETPVELIVANCIRSLRMLEAADWKAFFERISETERILRGDPAGVYARMDFETRDAYRKAVEELAAGSGRGEEEVAGEAVRLARECAAGRGAHIGYHLIDAGFETLGRVLGYRPGWPARWRRFVAVNATASYLTGIAATTLAVEWAVGRALTGLGASAPITATGLVLGLVPAMTVAVTLVNGLVTRLMPPRVLPKMDFRDGIPADCQTMVVVPVILADVEDVTALLANMEIRWLANEDPHLHCALLVDPPDAPQEHMPADEALLQHAVAGVRSLNSKYGQGAEAGPFHLFYRRRRWNAAEGCWMGWERKRGKLMEFNRLLAGGRDTSFALHVGNPSVLPAIRFVITIDADTDLPRETARRLVATLTHPLNRAEFDPVTGTVRAGYTILQPRIEINPLSAEASRFAQLFVGGIGLDLYTRAVSDAYQDLFAEGIFVGKGIYDPEAFQRSLRGATPENGLLSHDLFEGIHGRAALVTDVVLLEDHPPDYLTYARRQHRWARGDWQLLPWLGSRVPLEGGGRGPTPLSLISRWKILDNLRSALLAPSLLAFLVAAWGWFPGAAILWTLVALAVPAAPTIIDGVGGLLAASLGGRREDFAAMRQIARKGMGPWLVQVVFLPHLAAVLCDAAARTLFRLIVSRRHLLEWQSTALTARSLAGKTSRRSVWREMAAVPVIVAVVALLLVLRAPDALLSALPLLLVWCASPEVAVRISRPRRLATQQLDASDTRRLRLLARRTWLFFETFVGPEDQWLPPDHFQEDPGKKVARRTSPTNIGMLLLATLAAYDLGYAGLLAIALRLKDTFESLVRMERHSGHFYNWYDTRTLEPLAPRYLSTVDSGNLAASLLVLKQGCAEFAATPVLGDPRWQGLLDTLAVLEEVVDGAGRKYGRARFAGLRACVEAMQRRAAEVRTRPGDWGHGLYQLLSENCVQLDRALIALIESGIEGLDANLLAELRIWSSQTHQHLESMRRDMELCLPWVASMASPPGILAERNASTALARAWAELEASLPLDLPVARLPAACDAAKAHVQALDALLAGMEAGGAAVADARAWLTEFAKVLGQARETHEGLLGTLSELARQADRLFREMEFPLLYDRRRRVFFLGYNVTAGRMDEHHYDLLASEARVASFLAIAKGDAPEEHWLQLGRPLGRANGSTALLSWSATMFEYLMPTLLLRESPESLIGRGCRTAVQEQMAYAKRRGVPWGISESSYYQFDAQQNYQYRAFGVPTLGFKRGLEDDLVVAPYASLLALRFAPGAVIENLERFERLGLGGRYGLCEAVDFTPARLPPGRTHAVVRSFMAHHQGMILAAIDNVLNAECLVRRFHAEPLVQTAALLLFERPALRAPVEQTRPAAERVPIRVRRGAALQAWSAPPDAPFPQAHVLSNGRYHMVMSAGGGGYSQWDKVRLTRWRGDPTLDDLGFRIYVRDVNSGAFWSLAADSAAVEGEVVFHPHMVERYRRAHGLSVRERVCVAPEDDIEIRYLTVTNEERQRRRVEVTSHAEVVLGDAVEDRRHPAFSKLFVESEYVKSLHALLFHRRPRAAQETPAWLVHRLVLPEGRAQPGNYESARERFVGRGRSLRAPAMLEHEMGGRFRATGAVLDPIMALSAEIELAPRQSVAMAYLLAAAESRAAALTLAGRHRSLSGLEWVFELARRRSEAELAALRLPPEDLPVAQKLLSLLLYPYYGLRAPRAVLAQNQLGQSALWKYAISGDLPILLVAIREAEDCAVLQTLLPAQAFWRGRGMSVDLVIVNEQPTGYGAEVDHRIARVIAAAAAEGWMHREGGVFLIRGDQLSEAERTALFAIARVVLDPAAGSVAEQIARLPGRPARLPPLVPTAAEVPPPEPLGRPGWLLFDNGLGGFSPDGRDYVIHLDRGKTTPAPWANVLANPGFGCLVTESGGGYTWAENSAENRLTPWRNDPVSDEPAEALYLRDEETGAVWTPTPLPAPGPGSYQVRHGAGYTVFRHRSHALDQEASIFVPWDAPVKIVRLKLANRLERPRRVTATYYVEWLLGVTREIAHPFVIPEFDTDSESLLARNPWHDDFRDRVAFAAASEKLHGLTGDRTEFLGRHGSYAEPAAMRRIGLASAVRPGLDPCAALQVHLDLAPGASAEVHFMLGQAADRDGAIALVRRYRERAVVDAAWADLVRHWDDLLGSVTVRTPDPALDLMLNRWFLYQTLAGRFWGRTGYYQSSGAFGFRDQLQDAAALIHAAPALCRAHILEAARRQFEQGDVLHWWQPPSGVGVRTRCSDDLLWLPFITAHYVAATGDVGILDEQVPLLTGEELRPDEGERYARFPAGERTATLYEHCVLALQRGHTAGPHGLPLIGSCDWNDGMNRVGRLGRGESVWLGWFLYATLMRFAPIAERVGDKKRAEESHRLAETLRRTIEEQAWDGAWYRRGYYDDGRPLGSAQSLECRIDSIAQAWAVLSGGGDPQRAAVAMNAVRHHLVREEDGMILLLTPPFDRSEDDPGYIKAYPPGIRENGGQYTHAAIWVLWALAELGDGDSAVELFQKLLPIRHAKTAQEVARYRVEPYVIAADVYSVPPHTGRGGWTWYTGSAAWAYRLGIEVVVGLRPEEGGWRIDPCIPRSWPGFDVVVRDGSTVYEIRVENPEGVNYGVERMLLDGRPLEEPILPRLRDGKMHRVGVWLR